MALNIFRSSPDKRHAAAGPVGEIQNGTSSAISRVFDGVDYLLDATATTAGRGVRSVGKTIERVLHEIFR